MTSLDDLRESPTQIAELIGAPVRVDLVKESKAVPIFGNFYTWDPESHSVVLAKFHSKDFTDPSEFLLLPGSSIQNVQVLQSIAMTTLTNSGQQQEESTATQSTSSALSNTMPDGTMLVENSKELQAKLDQIFHKTEKIKAKTVVTPKKGQDNSRKRSRDIYEELKIFDQFVQSKRHRLIDALNKNRIKFKEEPIGMKERLPIKGAILPANGQQPEQVEVEAENGLEIPTKIVILGAGCSIFPPYGKSNIQGNPKAVKRITLTLVEECVFVEG